MPGNCPFASGYKEKPGPFPKSVTIFSRLGALNLGINPFPWAPIKPIPNLDCAKWEIEAWIMILGEEGTMCGWSLPG